MTAKKSNVIVGIFLIVFLFTSALFAQQPQPSTTDDLRKEIQALSEAVKAMQKDLQDIKSMLQSRAPAAPPENVLLDLGNHPVRGNGAAKLILVEFSDYQ